MHVLLQFYKDLIKLKQPDQLNLLSSLLINNYFQLIKPKKRVLRVRIRANSTFPGVGAVVIADAYFIFAN